MKVFSIKKILFCVLLSVLLLVGISAATWEEMQENGAVSDGGIRLGDARDGIVSDVSAPSEDGVLGDIITEASDALGDLGGNGGSGSNGGTGSNGGSGSNGSSDNGNGGSDIGNGGSGSGSGSSDSGEEGGMTMGIIIAILVVIAVIIVVFLLLPKKK